MRKEGVSVSKALALALAEGQQEQWLLITKIQGEISHASQAAQSAVKNGSTHGSTVLLQLRAARAFALVLKRENPFDYWCCKIRDCFGHDSADLDPNGWGHGVVAWARKETGLVAGQNSTLCFGRRQFEHAQQGEVQCHIDDIPAFVQMANAWATEEHLQNRAQRDGFARPTDWTASYTFAMEELTLYTHPDPMNASHHVAKSTAAWVRLLAYVCAHLGIGATNRGTERMMDAIEAEMKAGMGQRELSPHSRSFANAAAVRRAVFENGSQWLRSKWRD